MKKILLSVTIFAIFFGSVFLTAEVKTAQEILEKSNQAMGGDMLWEPVEFVRTVLTQSSQGINTEISVIEDRRSGRAYMTTNMPLLGELTMGYDGENTWMISAFHRGYLGKNDQLAQLISESSESYIKIKTGEKKFIRLEDEVVNGRDCYVLQSTMRDNTGEDLPEKYYFDKSTYYLIRKETQGFKLMGITLDMVEKYSEFKDVEGKVIPYVTVVEGGIISSVSTITEIEFNPYVSEEIFKFGQAEINPNKTGESAEYEYHQKKIDSFELIWNKIKDYHWNPDFDLPWWENIRAEFRPLVESTETDAGFVSLMNKMVSMIEESHTVVIPKENSDEENAREVFVDVDVRWLNGEPVITRINDDGIILNGQVRPGDVILEIGDKTVSEILGDTESEGHDSIYKTEFKNESMIKNSLSTLEDEPLEIKISRNGQTVSEQLTLSHESFLTEKNPYEPNFRYRELNGKVGYIAFDLFMGDIVPLFEEAVSTLYGKNAIIIDLRGNHGGQVAIMMAMANLLLENPASLGEFVFRNSVNSFDIECSGEKAYAGEVIFLIDSQSASCAEIFPQGMRDIGRAAIIGQPSSGLALLSSMDTLPTGDTFQYVVANYRSPLGITIEGKGVAPDVEYYPTRSDWEKSNDPVLDFALEYISNR